MEKLVVLVVLVVQLAAIVNPANKPTKVNGASPVGPWKIVEKLVVKAWSLNL